MKPTIKKDIVIFQFGKTNNNFIITKEAVLKSMHNFVNKPITINDSDHYRPKAIGHISSVNRCDARLVYGDIVLYDDYSLGRLNNYSIIHNKAERIENSITYVDDFELADISYDIIPKINTNESNFKLSSVSDLQLSDRLTNEVIMRFPIITKDIIITRKEDE